MNSTAEYSLIGIAEAKRLIADGVGEIDAREGADVLREWEHDADAMEPEVVYTSMVAGLA
jgi:hypothetical protein